VPRRAPSFPSKALHQQLCRPPHGPISAIGWADDGVWRIGEVARSYRRPDDPLHGNAKIERSAKKPPWVIKLSTVKSAVPAGAAAEQADRRLDRLLDGRARECRPARSPARCHAICSEPRISGETFLRREDPRFRSRSSAMSAYARWHQIVDRLAGTARVVHHDAVRSAHSRRRGRSARSVPRRARAHDVAGCRWPRSAPGRTRGR